MKRLVIVAGPTAVGKTAYAVHLARQWNTEILSCDSRQFYHELRIGVARPSDDELAAVTHHFIACRSVANPYNIYDFASDARILLTRLFSNHDTVVAAGGSGLYIDALLHQVAPMPNPSPELRASLQQMPLAAKQARLRQLDPDYYARVDLENPARLQRALEVCLTTGRPYSQVIASHQRVPLPYEVEMRILSTDRQQLRQRINNRVDRMMADGLLEEVRQLIPFRHLNTLNTVGYRELFPVLDGTDDLEQAIGKIKLNTWHYARKQLTWLRRYPQATTVQYG